MGQSLSMTKKSRRKTRKFLTSQLFMRENNNLSHTFAVFDDEPATDLVNVNTASENELLKVRDINLELSKNIIKHRKAIGYFQKVEDLVVVPGMGAEKLNKIRHCVCVASRNIMRNSLQSFDSIKSVDSRSTLTKANKLVNVNKASIFELQLVHGVTQEIAAAIFYYRSKKGPFKRLEDLRSIKCIDCILLDNISRYLTVQTEEDISDESEGQSQSLILNGSSRTNDTLNFAYTNGTTKRLLASTEADIFELLSAYSPRPIIRELFRYSRNEKPAFRVSSWNLDCFSVDKATNLGVKEVICRTILENGWSIVAIQNIVDQDALKYICDELNEPELQRVREWKSNKNSWKYNMIDNENSNLGFIYDTKGVDEISVTTSEKAAPELYSVCDSLISNFTIGNTEIQIINLKVKALSGLVNLQDYLQKLMNVEAQCLICGDFSSLPSNTELFTNTKLVLPTNISNRFHLTTNSTKYFGSNFVVNNRLENNLTGLQGVQRGGLTHLAIPSGWSWGGSVSMSCPIWVEFFVNPN